MSCLKWFIFVFSGTKALKDAGLDYGKIDQAVVGYCYGEFLSFSLKSFPKNSMIVYFITIHYKEKYFSFQCTHTCNTVTNYFPKPLSSLINFSLVTLNILASFFQLFYFKLTFKINYCKWMIFHNCWGLHF